VSENEYIRVTTIGKLESLRRVLMLVIEDFDLITLLKLCDLGDEKAGMQAAYRAVESARVKLSRSWDEDDGESLEVMRRAIHEASYALNPNQGERPDPVRASMWLRTTFGEGHPNYVDPESLEGTSAR
jgi:hypothetical protein